MAYIRDRTLGVYQALCDINPIYMRHVPVEMRDLIQPAGTAVHTEICVTHEVAAREMHRALVPIDPLTMEPPSEGQLFAFRAKGVTLFPVASLDSINYMIKTGYKGSNNVYIFSPLHNAKIPISEIHWILF